MANDLVRISAVEAFLGVTADDVLKALVDQVVGLFFSACGRAEVPFQEAETDRVERFDATTRPTLFLEYPIDGLTSVKLGLDRDNPDEDLDPSDKAVLQWVPGSARITRVDGRGFAPFSVGVSGLCRPPGYVEVTYDAAEDLPADVKPALLKIIAQIWRQRGSEDARSESTGGYREDLATVLEGDPLWQATVSLHRRIRL